MTYPKLITSFIFILSVSFQTRFIAQSSDQQNLTVGLAAINLSKYQLEIAVNGVYSYGLNNFNYDFSQTPHRIDADISSWSGTLGLTYGLTSDKNLNIGWDANYARSSVTSYYDNGNTSNNNFLLTGPRLRWRPFGQLGEGFDFTLEHYVRAIVSGKNELISDTPLHGHLMYLTRYLESVNMIIILRTGVQFSTQLEPIETTNQTYDPKQPFDLPVQLFVSYYPRNNFVLFGAINYVTHFGSVRWADDTSLHTRARALLGSAGLQYIFLNSYTFFAAYEHNLYNEKGFGSNSVNIGLRLLIQT